MQRGDKHGFRVDDEMAKETRGIVTGGHDPRAEEWRSAEPSGEDQPAVDWDARPDEDRVVLATLLGKEIWPATGSQVRERVREQHGPDRIIDLVDRVPEGRVFDNLADLWESVST